jgi:hypothetical protein
MSRSEAEAEAEQAAPVRSEATLPPADSTCAEIYNAFIGLQFH